jgi:putative membrane protein
MIRGYSDHAANERTFLAWVRTGIAVIALGFVIEKFNLFLVTFAGAAISDAAHSRRLARLSGPLGRFEGVAFMFVGLALLILATARFVRTTRMIDASETYLAKGVRAELILSGVLLLLGTSYGIYLALS